VPGMSRWADADPWVRGCLSALTCTPARGPSETIAEGWSIYGADIDVSGTEMAISEPYMTHPEARRRPSGRPEAGNGPGNMVNMDDFGTKLAIFSSF